MQLRGHKLLNILVLKHLMTVTNTSPIDCYKFYTTKTITDKKEKYSYLFSERALVFHDFPLSEETYSFS